MLEEFDDPGELAAQIREHQRLTGTEPKEEESNGMTRRDLLVRGGAAWFRLPSTQGRFEATDGIAL